jgi:hypothetical protein
MGQAAFTPFASIGVVVQEPVAVRPEPVADLSPTAIVLVLAMVLVGSLLRQLVN